MRFSRTLCAVVLLSGGTAALSAKVSVASQEFHQSFALSPCGRVVIDNPYGDVRISAWDRREVRVEATKSAPDSAGLDAARIVVQSTESTLSIRTQYAGLPSDTPASVEYRITVPRTANLDGVHVVNGELSLRGLTGSVTATSINGNIKAEKLEGRADLSTVNGQVEADFNRVNQAQSISLRSVNGPIVLSIPENAEARLIASNRSGGIQTDFAERVLEASAHRFHALLRGGGTEIQLENVNGGISVHSTWRRRPVRPEL